MEKREDAESRVLGVPKWLGSYFVPARNMSIARAIVDSETRGARVGTSRGPMAPEISAIQVVVYTDGSCKQMGRGLLGKVPQKRGKMVAGFGVWFAQYAPLNCAVPLEGSIQTSIRAEKAAIVFAIELIVREGLASKAHKCPMGSSRVTLRTDCEVNWKHKDPDLRKRWEQACRSLRKSGSVVSLEWVKGHADSYGNYMADRLASLGSFKKARSLLGPRRTRSARPGQGTASSKARSISDGLPRDLNQSAFLLPDRFDPCGRAAKKARRNRPPPIVTLDDSMESKSHMEIVNSTQHLSINPRPAAAMDMQSLVFDVDANQYEMNQQLSDAINNSSEISAGKWAALPMNFENLIEEDDKADIINLVCQNSDSPYIIEISDDESNHSDDVVLVDDISPVEPNDVAEVGEPTAAIVSADAVALDEGTLSTDAITTAPAIAPLGPISLTGRVNSPKFVPRPRALDVSSVAVQYNPFAHIEAKVPSEDNGHAPEHAVASLIEAETSNEINEDAQKHAADEGNVHDSRKDDVPDISGHSVPAQMNYSTRISATVDAYVPANISTLGADIALSKVSNGSASLHVLTNDDIDDPTDTNAPCKAAAPTSPVCPNDSNLDRTHELTHFPGNVHNTDTICN